MVRYTKEQTDALKKAYSDHGDKYPTDDEVQALVNELGLDFQQIRVRVLLFPLPSIHHHKIQVLRSEANLLCNRIGSTTTGGEWEILRRKGRARRTRMRMEAVELRVWLEDKVSRPHRLAFGGAHDTCCGILNHEGTRAIAERSIGKNQKR
jgi:hypothetical protein